MGLSDLSQAAAALEAEFSFDNIMAEVMAMDPQSKSKPEPAAVAANRGNVEDYALSFNSGRSSAADDTIDDEIPVPKKALPPPPEEFDTGDDDETALPQQQQQLPLPQLVPVGSLSPRAIKRPNTPPLGGRKSNTPAAASASASASGPASAAAAPLSSLGSASVDPTSPGRKSSKPELSVTSLGGSGKVSSSTGVIPSPSTSRLPSTARPIAKLLNDDGTLRCAKCNTTVSREATFCKHCGSTLKQAAAEQCAGCKLMLKPGVAVCGGCGMRSSSNSAGPASPSLSAKSAFSSSVPTLSISPRRSNASPGPGGGSSGPAQPSAQLQHSGSATLLAPVPTSPRRSASQQLASQPSTAPAPAAQPPQIGSPRRSLAKTGSATAPTSGPTSPRRSEAVKLPVAAAAGAAPRGSTASALDAGKTRVIMVGSGSSSGTPSLACLAGERCKACVDALMPGSRNRRRNPSLLIQHRGCNILIDCGKSFREAWIQVIEKYDVKQVHAVIISHGHADAFLGLDDLREVIGRDGAVVPVYARECDLRIIRATFPYLMEEQRAASTRFTSNIALRPIPDRGAFEVCGLRLRGIPLPHGVDSVALGFQFGPVVYFSDLSSVPDKVLCLRLAIFLSFSPFFCAGV